MSVAGDERSRALPLADALPPGFRPSCLARRLFIFALFLMLGGGVKIQNLDGKSVVAGADAVNQRTCHSPSAKKLP